MKLKGFYKDRSPKPLEVDGATFYIKPLSVAQFSKFQIVVNSGGMDFYSSSAKRSFATDHVDSWEGLFYEDGSEVEFTKENAISLLVDDSYEDLFVALFDFSFKLRTEIRSAAQEDSEKVKK